MENVSIRKFLEQSTVEQNNAWYDWFCNDKALPAKTVKLVNKLKRVVKSEKIDIDNNYVFFKNNCPCEGTLYDDFRICDLKTGEVIYTITPRSGHTSMNGKGTVWGKENNFNAPLIEGTWNDIKAFFDVGKSSAQLHIEKIEKVKKIEADVKNEKEAILAGSL